jgi:5-(hydroxymethyl)furfural/furfural oxidase
MVRTLTSEGCATLWGLRVVDASLFPCVPCVNTNSPTMMTAEKISDAMLSWG